MKKSFQNITSVIKKMFKKDNISMIVALASLITSITACTLANKQNEIAEAQWKAEQAVNQPIFQIDIDLPKKQR